MRDEKSRVAGIDDEHLPMSSIAILLVVHESYTFAAAAKAVGVGEQSLRKWHARLAPKPEPCGENASTDELRAEIQRLRSELRRAEMEREILKKATAYFAKESQ
jgi:transposase